MRTTHRRGWLGVIGMLALAMSPWTCGSTGTEGECVSAACPCETYFDELALGGTVTDASSGRLEVEVEAIFGGEPAGVVDAGDLIAGAFSGTGACGLSPSIRAAATNRPTFSKSSAMTRSMSIVVLGTPCRFIARPPTSR